MARGSRASEQPTQMPAPAISAGVTLVAVGTAPIHLAAEATNINTPIFTTSLTEFQKKLGYSDNWENYTLCEIADAAYNEYQVSPVVFINVLNPSVHKKAVAPVNLNIENNRTVLEQDGVIKTTLKLVSNSSTLVEGADYLASYDGLGKLTIVFLVVQEGAVTAEFDVVDPSKVTEADIIGGYDVNQKATGLELLNKVFSRTKRIPGLVVAPKWATKPTVAAVMRAKVQNINTLFKSFALTDIDASVVTKHTDAEAYKNGNNYTGKFEAVGWPMAAKGGKVYHLSTQVACSILRVCQSNNNFPYESASNKPIPIDALVVKVDGKYEEIDLEIDQANLLNEQGIVTAINWLDGFTVWGNNTAAFPLEKDVKDKFHAVRIMHNYIGNTIILTTWNEVDGPIKKKTIDTIVDEMNIWFNGLMGAGAIIGGRCVALNEDNPKNQLLAGKIKLRYYVGEPVPIEEIDNVLEYDTAYYDTLFS